MLSRLWRWAVPKATPTASVVRSRAEQHGASTAAPPQPAGPVTSASTGAAPVQNASRSGGPRPSIATPDFFATLEAELAPVPSVPDEDEPLISGVVLQVVDHVTRKKVDPPVVPALVPRVLAIVDEPEVDLAKLTHVIQQDLAISAKLLSVANSPVFTTGIEVKTVRQAISYLGTEQVAQVAIGLACQSSFEAESRDSSPYAPRWQRLFQHGMTSAFAAAQLAKGRGHAAQEAAFLGGLFHDVGKAVALRALEAIQHAGRLPAVDADLIDEALHRIHAYPGEEFYDKWTLPEALMELCASHHQLDSVEVSDPTFYTVVLVSSFDTLQSGSASEQRDALTEARLSAQKLALTDAALQTAYASVRALRERTQQMFSAPAASTARQAR
jgi:HD-like signal output (HDOD) protein